MYNNILFDAKYYLFQLLGVLDYLNQVLLDKYRKMFVPFELTEFYIFHNTKNKIESQYAKLKKILGFTTSQLRMIFNYIIQMVESQHLLIKRILKKKTQLI